MNALVIARRDLASYLQGYSAYVIIASLLLVNGLFFEAFALYAAARRRLGIHIFIIPLAQIGRGKEGTA